MNSYNESVELAELQKTANQIRANMVETSQRCHVPHLGSCLSCVDILVGLYWKVMNIDPLYPKKAENDTFILSKGHGAHALFTVLAYRGYYKKELLNDYGKTGSPFGEHPSPDCVPGVEIATGSLGHGLSFALGQALAARIQKINKKFFVLLGDGEINEGSVWEAALFAAANKLDNVVAVVDFNKWQATGRSCEVMALQPLADKWAAFGWEAVEINGHDMQEVVNALKPSVSGRPKIVIANTIKAKGVSFMEDDNNWHYRIPSPEEVILAKQELL